MAEFAYNSFKSIHRYSPFFTLYGWNPKAVHFNDENEDIGSPVAKEWLNRMVIIHRQIQDTLKRINDKHSKMHIDKSRQFVFEDMAYIDRRNLRIKGNRSLANKWIWLFRISKVISRHTYEVKLAPKSWLHKVIHTSLLKPTYSRIHEQMNTKEDNIEYDMAEIINSRKRHGNIEYRIRWDRYTEDDDTWEKIDNLNCLQKLSEFHEKYPQKPCDLLIWLRMGYGIWSLMYIWLYLFPKHFGFSQRVFWCKVF